jgi:hypothetical protein
MIGEVELRKIRFDIIVSMLNEFPKLKEQIEAYLK